MRTHKISVTVEKNRQVTGVQQLSYYAKRHTGVISGYSIRINKVQGSILPLAHREKVTLRHCAYGNRWNDFPLKYKFRHFSSHSSSAIKTVSTSENAPRGRQCTAQSAGTVTNCLKGANWSFISAPQHFSTLLFLAFVRNCPPLECCCNQRSDIIHRSIRLTGMWLIIS